MGDDKQLPPQAVDVEQILEDPAELGIFVMEKLLIIMKDRPLHIRMQVDFRLVDGDDERQVPPSFFIDDEVVFHGYGPAEGHLVDMGNDTECRQGNELHIVGPGPVRAAQELRQEEDIDEVGRIELPTATS